MKIELTQEEYELARFTVESELIELRDARILTLRNNGLCIKEKDGTPSSIIRMGFETAMLIAIEAINAKRASN